MKKDFNDAIMKLEDFCKTYKALSMEDKLLFAVLGPNGSDVAATVANEINEPKDPHGGLTDEEFSKYSHFGDNDYKGTDSVHFTFHDPSSLKSMGPGDPGPKGPDAYLCVIKHTKEGYPYNPVCCAHCDGFDCPFEESETYPEDDLVPGGVDIIQRIIEEMSTEHLSGLDCATCMLTPDTWMPLKDGNFAMYDSEGDIFDVFIDGEHYFEKPRYPIPKDPHGGLTDEEFSKYSSFGSDKKTIKVNGEEVPVIDDGEIVVFTVRVKDREDFAMVEGRLRHIGYLRDNDVNPLVSVADESYVVVTADDVEIGVYTPLDMRSFPLRNAIRCYADAVSRCEPTFEWHNIIRVTTYSSMARGKIDLVLRHLEEDGIVEAEEDVCVD